MLSSTVDRPWPVWDQKEEQALRDTVFSGKWGTLGPSAMRLASEFAGYIGVKHAIAVTSGTVGLEIILRGLGIGYGDEVIVTAYTFAATVSAIAMTGATPVFADIALPSCNLDPGELEAHITEKTKAVVAVHVAGQPCDMGVICRTAKKHGLYVVEDASHAHGSEYGGKKTGALGDAAVFSCQNSKNITCGEGGLVVTDDEAIFAQCWRYHDSGRQFDGQTGLGTNARMTEFQACVLSKQLGRMPGQLEKRTANALHLIDRLSEIREIVLPEHSGFVHSWFLFQILFKPEYMGLRDDWIKTINENGVPASRGYPNLAREGFLAADNRYFRKTTGAKLDYAAVALPNTDLAARSAMWLPGRLFLGETEHMDAIAEAFYQAKKAKGAKA